ncbi:MAG: Spy/CpxP family protein refolding chaperone [Acidobacteria bacterium]|nr:Spy/CpxP family protein refolding chaperone [Acidobacteriota bacterium]
MKSNRVKWLVGTMIVGLLGAVAVSQTIRRARWEGQAGMFGGPSVRFLARYLDLSEAQRDQVKQILAKEKPTVQPLILQMAQNRKNMRQIIESGPFDEARARTLATQQSQTMAEFLLQKARIESELVQVLTPEQKAKLDQLLDKHEQRVLQRLQAQPAAENEGGL